jgi:hypothetical protein
MQMESRWKYAMPWIGMAVVIALLAAAFAE